MTQSFTRFVAIVFVALCLTALGCTLEKERAASGEAAADAANDGADLVLSLADAAGGDYSADGFSSQTCGNGAVDTDEQCDDGDTDANDECTYPNCSLAECGDGNVWTSSCDDQSLNWQTSATSGQKSYADAATYCSGLGAGWRLPTITELRTTVSGCDAADWDSDSSCCPSCDCADTDSLPTVLFVDDDNSTSNQVFDTDLTTLGYNFTKITVSSGGNGPAYEDTDTNTPDMKDYDVVFWSCGINTATLTATDQAEAITYLSNGGRMLLEGSKIGTQIGTTTFYQTYLKSIFKSDSTDATRVNGVSGDPISNGISNVTAAGMGPDWVDPDTDSAATAFLTWSNGKNSSIRADSGTYRTVYYGFYLWFMGQTDRRNLVDKSLKWLKPHNPCCKVSDGCASSSTCFATASCVDNGCATNSNCYFQSGITGPCDSGIAGSYWSSTTVTDNSSNKWVVRFREGEVNQLAATSTAHVRCVKYITDSCEECDDGNTITDKCNYGDTECVVCASDCDTEAGVTSYCGDGLIDTENGEECDDGNTITERCDYGDTSCIVCNSECDTELGATSYCGDAVKDTENGEQCDDGDSDNSDSCLTTCENASCGDGFVWSGVEECDDADTDNTDDCLNTCQSASCGDGFMWVGVEQCDDGDWDNNDFCLTTCQSASCGDGFTWAGVEQCDDGNLDNNDFCLTTCQNASCGDGFVWSGVEECDDVDTDNTDDCLNTCQSASCGDGFVWSGHEDCDDGDSDNTDNCLDTCENASCGDGFVWTGVEECDDGDSDNQNDCTNVCEYAECGDGIVWDQGIGMEECDDGDSDNQNDCTNVCEYAECGDGTLWNSNCDVRSVNLDGYEEYASIQDTGSGSVFDRGDEDSITVTGWAKIPDEETGDVVLLGKFNGLLGENYSVWLDHIKHRLTFCFSDGANRICWEGKWPGNDGYFLYDEWQFFAITFTFGDETSIKGYRAWAPGELTALSGATVNWNYADNAPVQNNSDVAIGVFKPESGAPNSSTSEYANMYWTDFAIWDKNLTEAEIQEAYNNGCPPDLTTHSAASYLDAYWRPSVTDLHPIIEDKSANGLDLVLHKTEMSDVTKLVPCAIGNGCEQCDDGNTQNGDGCSSNCAIEMSQITISSGNKLVESDSYRCYLTIGGSSLAATNSSNYRVKIGARAIVSR